MFCSLMFFPFFQKDDTRIVESLPTIQYLLNNDYKVVLLSHLGRPKGKVVGNLSLKPVVEYLSNSLNQEIPLLPHPSHISNLTLKGGEMVVLENLRFWEGEEANDPDFAKQVIDFPILFVFQVLSFENRLLLAGFHSWLLGLIYM